MTSNPLLKANMNRELMKLSYRLEAATSRLEDLVTPAFEEPKLVNGNTPPSTETPKSTGTGATPPAPVVPPAPTNIAPPKATSEPLPESIEDFDAFLDTAVKKFVENSNEIGGAIAAQV